MPPRDRRPGETPRGTAVIRGMVVAAETGTPLRRAQVRVMPQGPGNAALAQTDAEGRFEVKDLAGGRYLISATRSGYATVQLGQRAASRSSSLKDKSSKS
jgi:hypothetical protein